MEAGGKEVVGVDGCRAGWLAVVLAADGRWRFQVAGTLRQVVDSCPGAGRILLDMPLGLLDGPESERECDREARRLLGRPRASSVFTPPARPTLAAADYGEALQINRRSVGKGLSRQAWNLVPKIREADRLRRRDASLDGRLRESHPELCFWSLHQRRAPLYNKKTPAGREERLAILQRYRSDAREIAATITNATLRREVARDDILDAMVLAVTASLESLSSLPIQPARDRYGIAMEIVYPSQAIRR